MPSQNQRRNGRYNKKDVRMPMLLILGAALLLMILVLPKSPVVVAVNAGHDAQDEIRTTHAGLRISEVMSDNTSALPDENGNFGDWVEVVNTSDVALNLKNVGLSDRSDRIAFLFPDTVLGAGERIVVFCDDVNRTEENGRFHAKFKLSSYGETLFLFDTNGVAIDQVTVPVLNADESYILTDENTYEITSEYSPGYENTGDGYRKYMAAYTVEPGVLVINEIMASPRSGLRDADDELSDWVELYNSGDEPIYLSNYALSDDEGKPVKWVFPQNAVIPGRSYYVVFCSGKDKVEESTYYPHTNFGISAEHETIVLSTLTGQLVDRVTIDNLGKDLSYGRDPHSMGWQIYTLATPGVANNQAGANKADEYLRATNPTGVFISEVVSSADQVIALAGGEAADYVEIYNSSVMSWDMSGWGLSDNINWPRKWTFPQGTIIYPGEYKVVMLDKSEKAGTDGSRLHASFAITRVGGEMLTLSDATGRVLDRLYLPEIPGDTSYGRTLGAGGFFYYDIPTPGAANGLGFYGFAERPAFSMAGGLYEGIIRVEVTAPEGATVRYTTDGSIPTVENSNVYTEPFEISNTTVLRIRAFQEGLQPSSVVSASYIMNTYHTLDVVSLVIDPDELYNPVDGLLTVGEDAICEKIPYKNTIYREFGKIARPSYVEVFDQETGKAVISQGAKLDLMGDYSLDMPQKSMKVRANAASGSKFFEYPLFENREFESYKSFTLRNSGNDCVWTRVSDGVQNRLIEKYVDTDIITLAWKPVVVYINGVYWGHYNMRERKDEYCIAQHEGLDVELAGDINIIRGNSSEVQGTNDAYLEMRSRIKDSSPNTNQEDRNYLDANIDIDSYIDWFAIKMFFGDSDPGNIMFYRLPTEGSKWKCIIFDMDYGLFSSSFDSPWSYMKEKGMGQQNINNVIFRKILEVDEYRDRFLTRLGLMYQRITVPNMQAELDECIALIAPEMPIHFERWAEYNDKKINSDSPLSADGAMRYWKERIRRMREETMVMRPYNLYGFVQTQFQLSDEDMSYYFGGPRPEKPQI